MSVAKSLENVLLATQNRTGQKKAKAWAKLKKKVREGRTFLFSHSKGFKSKKEE